MQKLKPHECILLDMLVSKTVSAETIHDIKDNPNITSLDVTGNGYFVTINHPDLPEDRIILNEPLVIGESSGVETGFVIFIEKKELTIECHGWGDQPIPKNYRELGISIRRA